MDVSVRELKSGLSQFLRRAQRGETIQVTSRGKPVAHLVPVLSSIPVSEQLQSLPGIDPGSSGKPKGTSRPVRIEPGQKSLSDIVPGYVRACQVVRGRTEFGGSTRMG